MSKQTVPRRTDNPERAFSISGSRKNLRPLLNQCEPLFIYRDDNGDDWVRVAAPVGLVLGLNEARCDCCDSTLLDVAYKSVRWYVQEARP